MFTSRARRTAVLSAFGLLALAAPSAEAQTAKKTQSVDLRFAAVNGVDPVRCGTPITGLGTTAASAQLQDLRFFVSDVRLVKRGGRTVPVRLRADSPTNVTRGHDAVTLIDLENGAGACGDEGNGATNAAVRGTVPRGTYEGVRWTVGVPHALNHTDLPASPAPLNSTAMAWSWQVGRKFAKIELTDAGTGPPWAAKTFFVHVGSVVCKGDPAAGQQARCDKPNRASVRLKRFDPARQQVAVDIAELVEGTDVTVNRAGAPGCMSGPTDPECNSVFGALGIDWAADGSGNGASGATRQTLFRAIAR